MSQTDFDVIIAGAGPAGSSAAHALAASGVRVAVFDRDEFPRPKPCARGGFRAMSALAGP